MHEANGLPLLSGQNHFDQLSKNGTPPTLRVRRQAASSPAISQNSRSFSSLFQVEVLHGRRAEVTFAARNNRRRAGRNTECLNSVLVGGAMTQ